VRAISVRGVHAPAVRSTRRRRPAAAADRRPRPPFSATRGRRLRFSVPPAARGHRLRFPAPAAVGKLPPFPAATASARSSPTRARRRRDPPLPRSSITTNLASRYIYKEVK
ncbi:unnamed protein product, partial [Urochloa humidicola]